MFLKDAGSIDEAVKSLTEEGLTQPLLFKAQNKFWIKADHTAILVSDYSCFADGVEALVHFMFACDVCYPHELHLVYTFLERLMGIKTKSRSVIVDNLFASLNV
jgi:hypothetical protein